MDDFLPSEVARLVLGYLKEVNCIKSWETFLGENPSLQEYYYLYTNGRVYCTNVDEKSLLEILSVYRSLKKYGDKIVNEIKRCEKEYNSNPDTRQDIIDEIANMVSLTFQKYLPLNIGNIMSVPTSDMTTAIFSEAQGNIFDDPASKSTVANNLAVYTSQSDNAETNTFSEASENTDSTYEMPHISEVYSLSNVNDNSLSSYNPTDFNIPTIESVKSSSETLHIELTKDKCLEKVTISNTEVGNSNLKDCPSHNDNESQAYCVMSKNLSACSSESVNDHVSEKCDSDLISASSANVEAKDTSSVEMSQADILENDNKLAESVLSNSYNIESPREVKPDLNTLNHLIQNLENNESHSDSSSKNSLSRPDADVCGNNNLELNHDLSYNNQSTDREVSNSEKKLDSSTDGRNFVTATDSYQFSTIPTVPTYILAGNVLMPNTFSYNYVISNPFSDMTFPVSSISYNIQNTNVAAPDTPKSEKDMLAPPNPMSESMLTLRDEKLVTKNSSEENILNTQNSVLENILTLPDGQLEKKSNSIDENGCKDKDESFKKSSIKTYEGRKRKTGGCTSAAVDKHPCSKRVSKKKPVVEKHMFPSCTSEQNKEMQVEATPTISEPEVSALQLLSLITGQKEYYDGPNTATEDKTKNESKIVEKENVIDISEENVTQLCSAKEILKMSDALKSNNKWNKLQKQLNGIFESKNIQFQQESHENESFSSHQIDELENKDQNSNGEGKSQESNKVGRKSHENESSSNNSIYTDYKLQNMPCVILTQLDEYEIQKNELLTSLAHEEGITNQTSNSTVKSQKNNKLKPKSCENESFSSHLIDDIKDQNSIRKVKSQKTNKLKDEHHENESFSIHQTHEVHIKNQNSNSKAKPHENKSKYKLQENKSFSSYEVNIKDKDSNSKVKSQKTNKLKDESHENESFSSHQGCEVHIKNQNNNSKVKSHENNKSKCKSQENKSFSSYEVDIKDKDSNSKVKSQKTNKLKDESHENESLSSHQGCEVHIKNQNNNSKVKSHENNKSKCKSQENKSFSSYEVDIKDKNGDSKVKSQKTNKLKDESHETEPFSSHQTYEVHIKNQNSNSKVKSHENNKSKCKSQENKSFSSYEVDIKDKNSDSKVKSQKITKLKDESHENESLSSHQTYEVHIKNQNSNSKVKSHENNKSKCKSQENKSFSSYEVDIKDKNSDSKVKSQKITKLKYESHENESLSSHQTHEVHIKNQNNSSKVQLRENNKSFSSYEVDIKDKNSNSKVKSQKTNKLKNESFSNHQMPEVHIKSQNNNSKVKSQEYSKLKCKSYENESFSSQEVDIKNQNSNNKVTSQKTNKLKNESFSSSEVDIKNQNSNNKVTSQKTNKLKNESFSSHQAHDLHIKSQNSNSKVKPQENNKLKHKSHENESFSSQEVDIEDQNSNTKVKSGKSKKLKDESFSSHQTHEVHIKNQNSNSKVKSQENNKLKHKLHESFSNHEIDIKDQNSNSEVKSKKSKQLKDESHKNEFFSSHQTSEVHIKDQNINNKVKSRESTKLKHESYKNESVSTHQTHEIDANDPNSNNKVESEKNKKMKHELCENESSSSHQIKEINIKDQNSDSKVKSPENTMIQVHDKDKKSLREKKAVQNCKETNNLKKFNKKQSEDQNILPEASEELAEDKNDASQKEKQGDKIIKTNSYQKSIKSQSESAFPLNCNRALHSKISCRLYEIESHKSIKCQKSKNGPNYNDLLLPKISLEKIAIHSMKQNVKDSSSKNFSSIDQNKSFIHNEDNYLKATNKYEKLKHFWMLRNSNTIQEKSDREQNSCNLPLVLSSVPSLEDQYPKKLNYTEKDCSLKETENPELLSHSSFESPSIDTQSTRSATLVISTDLILQNISDSSSSSNEFNSEVFPSLTQTGDLAFQTKPAAQNLAQNAVMLNCNGNDSLSNKFNSQVFPSLTQTGDLVFQTKPIAQNLAQNAVMLNCNENDSLSNKFNSEVFPSLTQTGDLVFQTKPIAQNLAQNAVMLSCNGNDSLSNKFNSKVFPSLTQTENLVVQANPVVQNSEQNTQILNYDENSNKCGNLSPVINTEKETNSLLITDARKVLSCSPQKVYNNNKESAKKIKLTKCNRTKKINDTFQSHRFIIKKSISSYSEFIINSRDICKSIKALSLHDFSKKFSVSGSNLSTKIPELCSVSENDSNDVNEAGLQNNTGRKRKLENSCDVSNRLEFDSKISQFSDCISSKRTKKENCVESVLSSDSGVSEYLYKNTKFNNEVIQSSNCDSSKISKKQNCIAPSLSLDSGLSKCLYRSKMECIGVQKNYKQSFHPSFLPQNTVNKEVAGENILCSNSVYKDSKHQNMPCVTLTKLDEHEVHSLPHKLYHNIEEKKADCKNNFEPTTKTVSEGDAKMLSQNFEESIVSCSLKVSVHNLNNICDNNHKETFETNMETSGEKNSDISLAFTSCEKQLVISESNNASHVPKNTCSIDIVCDKNSASLETVTKNPIVSTEGESKSSGKVPPQWDIIQGAIEKYGCDYILSKINHYLNC